MIIEVRQTLLDPEMATVLDRCRRCGTEIYSEEALRRYDGLCEACFREEDEA